jgi:hypothetical protein
MAADRGASTGASGVTAIGGTTAPTRAHRAPRCVLDEIALHLGAVEDRLAAGEIVSTDRMADRLLGSSLPFATNATVGRSWHNPAALATGQPVRLLGQWGLYLVSCASQRSSRQISKLSTLAKATQATSGTSHHTATRSCRSKVPSVLGQGRTARRADFIHPQGTAELSTSGRLKGNRVTT